MGVLIGFAIMCYLVYLWMSKMKNRIDRKEYIKKEQERQIELQELKERERLIKEIEDEEKEEGDLFKEYDE